MEFNIYAFTTFFILGIVFFVFNLEWLGFVFVVLGFIALTYKEEKKFWKKSWEEVSSAEGSYPSGKLKEYTKSAAKQFADYTDQKEKKYDVAKAPRKLNKASKSLLDEFNNLFK
jgi:hypothetical protein